MSKLYKEIMGHSFIYLLFDMINKAIPFLLLPYITHNLITADYGRLELFNTYVSFFLYLLCLALIVGQLFFHKQDKKRFNWQLKLSIIFISIISVVLFLSFFLLQLNRIYLISILYSYCISIVQLRAVLFRVTLKTIHASLLFLVNISISTLLTYLSFEYISPSFEFRIISLLTPLVVLCIWSIYSILKEFNEDDKKLGWKLEFFQVLNFVFPLLPNGVINFIRFGADKIFIATFFGITQLAVFGVGYQFSMVANIFMLSLNQATMPFMVKFFSAKNMAKYIKLAICQFFVFLIFIIVFYFSFPFILRGFFSNQYAHASEIIKIYLWAYPIIFLSIMSSNTLFFMEKTWAVLLITVFSSGLHLIVLSYVYMYDIAYENVPYALLISSILSLITSLFLSVRYVRSF